MRCCGGLLQFDEVVSPPDLIAVRWDFDDDAVPLPGRTGLVAYLRVHARSRGSRVEVHQLALDQCEADVITDAWAMVLGRSADAHATKGAPGRRVPRPKRGAGGRDTAPDIGEG